MVVKDEQPVVVTASTTVSGGVLVRVADDEWSLVPWHVDFEAHNLPWVVEGVLYTDVNKGGSGTPEIEALTIRRRPGGPAVDPDMIRGIRLGEIRDKVIRQVAVTYKQQGDVMVAVPGATSHAMTPTMTKSKRGQRTKVDDVQKAVDAYRAAKASGRTDLLAAVGEAIFASKATASRRLDRARTIGLLEVDE